MNQACTAGLFEKTSPLLSVCAKNLEKWLKKLLLRFWRTPEKIHIFWTKKSSPLILNQTNATAGTHTDLPVSDVDKNMQVSPFSKVPAKYIIRHCGERLKKVPIISIMDNGWVTANPYQALYHQNVLPWLFAKYSDGD
jgi:hypothetical protein